MSKTAVEQRSSIHVKAALRSDLPERQRLQILYERHRSYYENALKKYSGKLRKILIKTGINFSIKSRVKSFDSYFEKILRLRKEKQSNINIHDLLGIRVVCPFLEDINVVEKQIAASFTVLETERKNQKNSVREFSYDSVHLLILDPNISGNVAMPYVDNLCEIQLRTILQDAWAEVEHELIYKANFSLFNESIKRKLASLNASLTLSDIIFQEIRDYQKEIELRRERCREDINQMLDLPGGQDASKNTIGVAPSGIKPTFEFSLAPKSDLERRLFEALEAHSEHQYERAVQIYSNVIRMKVKPNVKSIVYNHRGMALFVQGKYNKAVQDFSKAIRNNPKDARLYNNRGMAYRMLKKYDLALKDFDTSIDLNVYQHEAYHIRALTYFDLMDYSNAIEDCRQALSINPQFEASQNLKAIILEKLGY